MQKTLSIPTNIGIAKKYVEEKTVSAVAEAERANKPSGNSEVLLVEFFDLNKLQVEIDHIVGEYKDHHRNLEVTILKQPITLSDDTITFHLNGQIQEGIFQKIKLEIQQTLRGRLNNYNIHVEAEMLEENNESSNKLYTSTDKLRHLIEKSPALREFQKRFGLETDF